MNEQEVNKLWEVFQVFDADGSGAISAEELGQVMHSLGQNPTPTELWDMIAEVDIDGSGSIDFEEFQTLMVVKEGDNLSRLKLAFSVFDEDGNGEITTNELANVMSKFGLTEQELNEMLKEVDHDGDGSIDFEEFCKLVPEESKTITGYKDLPTATLPNTSKTAPTPTDIPATNSESTTTDLELTSPQAIVSQKPTQEQGTSRLQMQIGLFRLIQGAAYRCFRENFSANHETHLRVKNLPYRITDFVNFVPKAIELYKGLGIVEESCYPVLDAVVDSLTNEYAKLEERIENWNTINKTLEMWAEQQVMLAARSKSANVKEKFTAGVEFALTMKKKHLSLSNAVEGVLAINELNRLRQIELNEEFNPPAEKSVGNPQEYLKQWNRVILRDPSEQVDGAMMPVAYWYEDFMPKLLAAFSVSTASDLESNTVADESALQRWFETAKQAGEFNNYGTDVAENFAQCTPQHKLAIKQAWKLTRHYLNGVQKRRERKEFGRESGELSHYIAFIDVYLGRTHVKEAQMRVSFPYYIGPGVWRFFHTTAEIVATKTPQQQTALIATFKEFFQLFATMYPCPYCRHHLNAYVLQNSEVEMYPLEYLVLGRELNRSDFAIELEKKLSTVVDGASLRLFFWKLHNTVNSSISRTEEWYHQDNNAFYTTRYWPSLDSELIRAKAFKSTGITTDRIYRIYGLLKPAARLSGLRMQLQRLLDKGDSEAIQEVCSLGEKQIKELEQAVLKGKFLQNTYQFNPDIVDQAPYFTPEEEEFGRSGVFVEA